MSSTVPPTRLGVRGLVGAAVLLLLAAGVFAYREAAERNMFIWLPAYAAQALAPEPAAPAGPVHLLFFMVDHWEPKVYAPTPAEERRRVERWRTDYPAMAGAHRDAYGRPPQHTWFYLWNHFEDDTMRVLNNLTYAGYGEVELHLHHRGDTAAGLRATLEEALDRFGEYGGLLTFEPEPQRRYGFIHGHWALDNAADHCGVNTELDVLRETACYADFTFPTGHQPSQPRQVNSIFYAVDTPAPKSYDTGTLAVVGGTPPARGLLLVQGSLGLMWRDWRPRIEAGGAFFRVNPPTPERADFWVRNGLHVPGRPEWRFVKTFCHGTEEQQLENFFDGPFDALFTYLESAYNDGERYVLHYVNAREAYNIIKAAEAGLTGDPDQYRDYLIPRYANQQINANVRYRLRSGGARVALELLEDAPATLAFRDGPLARLAGPVATLTADAQGGTVVVRAPGVLSLQTRRPIATVAGAAILPQLLDEATWTYVLEPAAVGVPVQWTYGEAA